MKSVKNRMAAVETQEEVLDPVTHKKGSESQCSKCGSDAALVSERVSNNRVIRQYRCEKCDVFFTR